MYVVSQHEVIEQMNLLIKLRKQDGQKKQPSISKTVRRHKFIIIISPNYK